MTISEGAVASDKRIHNKNKGTKGAGVTVVSVGMETKAYMKFHEVSHEVSYT